MNQHNLLPDGLLLNTPRFVVYRIFSKRTRFVSATSALQVDNKRHFSWPILHQVTWTNTLKLFVPITSCRDRNVGNNGQFIHHPWWRHQMETFSALLAICAGNSPVTGEFPSQRPVTQSFDVFFDLRLNKQFSKQSGPWWFETPSRPLWRHCNVSIR